MLPASTIPVNKGVAQVVFGTPTQQFAPGNETITFRGLDGGCQDYIEPPPSCDGIENGLNCSQFCCQVYQNNRTACGFPPLPPCCSDVNGGGGSDGGGGNQGDDVVLC